MQNYYYYLLFILSCRPVLVTDAMRNWAALKKWTKQYFIVNYGAEVVSFKGVSVC